ncbi:helix-turn-helix transcriptional regulator [Actinomadura montaniterrae]|uniref:Helix-turn-helix domain-containing protein n=1 Tax=Actinomadura montaniterrae TaxID=1803903 RepID=A0A6L3VR70_9ACTN|nr:helix-turn-helix domain-containing protein [Actinomadura montaniterrae]KAB2379290.1 helix-turn-helix domain-containing protein [Actinomadura montaniterrae]
MARRMSPGWLTVQEILDDLGIPRRTWQKWRELGRTPKCKRLPNGELRIRRSDYDAWLDSLEEVGTR